MPNPKVISLDEILKSAPAKEEQVKLPVVGGDELVASGDSFMIGGCAIKNTEYGTLLTFGIQHNKETKELKLVSTKPLRSVANKAAELPENSLIGPVSLSKSGDFFFFTKPVKK